VLELRSVSLRRPGAQLIEGLSLDLPDPGFYLIAGPSASGKTTLGRMSAGLLKPSAGQVLLDGESLYRAVGGPAEPLFYASPAALPSYGESLDEHFEAEGLRLNSVEPALSAVRDRLAAFIPGGLRRTLDSLATTELALVQVGLAAAAGTRLAVLDGQLDQLGGELRGLAARLLRESGAGDWRLVVLTCRDACADIPLAVTRHALAGGLPVRLGAVPDESYTQERI
jgi:glycerol transport system ATP-binding protein